MKKYLLSIMILVLSVSVFGSTLAYFSDAAPTEDILLSTGEIFTPPTPAINQYFLCNPDNLQGVVVIPAGETVLFISDHSAQDDVTFAEGYWDVVLKTDSNWSAFCETIFKECSPPGGLVVANHEIAYIMSLSQYSQTFTVRAGYYLGIEITNRDIIDHSCYVDGNSYVKAPEGIPINPIPEIPSGVLLAMGLLVLILVIFRYKKLQRVGQVK